MANPAEAAMRALIAGSEVAPANSSAGEGATDAAGAEGALAVKKKRSSVETTKSMSCWTAI